MNTKINPHAEYVRPYTLKQMSALYGVGYRTFLAWVKPFRAEVGKIRGRVLTIPQVRIVYAHLDYPPSSNSPDSDQGEKDRA